MTTRKAKVTGSRKPKLVCGLCGDPLTANPDATGWRAFLHTDESKIYDHRPTVSEQQTPDPVVEADDVEDDEE